MNINESNTFKQVAEVIGEEKALEELSKVFPYGLGDNYFNGDLDESFIWHESPQGHDFWADIGWGAIY